MTRTTDPQGDPAPRRTTPIPKHIPPSPHARGSDTFARQPSATTAPIAPDEDDGFEGDPAERWPLGFDDEAFTHGDRPSRPGHVVVEAAHIDKALRASSFDGSTESLSSGEEQRVRTLLHYRDSDLFRPHLIGAPAMLARLDALDRQQPNFAAVTRLMRRAAHLSMVAGAPLRCQPTVLAGPPGIGKSRYARALAVALGTSCDVIQGASLPDTGDLCGYPPVFRGAGPGRLAKFLITAPTSAPLVFIDEAEKIADIQGMAHPLDRILAVLEYGTASRYADENLQVPMRAQHAIFLFACNTLTALSEPFLDRVVTLHIPEPGRDARDAILEAMLGEVAGAIGLRISLAGREALAPLRLLSLRRCRLAFELAIGRAVEQERRFLTAQDLAEAASLLARPDLAQPIGFIRHRA